MLEIIKFEVFLIYIDTFYFSKRLLDVSYSDVEGHFVCARVGTCKCFCTRYCGKKDTLAEDAAI